MAFIRKLRPEDRKEKGNHKEYAKNLLENLTGLVERLHRMAYIPQPVPRVYVPYPAPPKCRPTTPATINSIEPTFNKDTGSRNHRTPTTATSTVPTPAQMA